MLTRHSSVNDSYLLLFANIIFILYCLCGALIRLYLQEECSGRPAATEEAVYARNKTVFERLARAAERQSISKQGREEIFVPGNRTNLHSSKDRFLWNII